MPSEKVLGSLGIVVFSPLLEQVCHAIDCFDCYGHHTRSRRSFPPNARTPQLRPPIVPDLHGPELTAELLPRAPTRPVAEPAPRWRLDGKSGGDGWR